MVNPASFLMQQMLAFVLFGPCVKLFQPKGDDMLKVCIMIIREEITSMLVRYFLNVNK